MFVYKNTIITTVICYVNTGIFYLQHIVSIPCMLQTRGCLLILARCSSATRSHAVQFGKDGAPVVSQARMLVLIGHVQFAFS